MVHLIILLTVRQTHTVIYIHIHTISYIFTYIPSIYLQGLTSYLICIQTKAFVEKDSVNVYSDIALKIGLPERLLSWQQRMNQSLIVM